MRAIRGDELERRMQVAWDTKKSLTYDKATGEWSWHDRDEQPVDAAGPYRTFWEALVDATEPYLPNEDRPRYAVQNKTQYGLFWSNRLGWTTFEDCDEYDSQNYYLPVDGQWVDASDYDRWDAVCEMCGTGCDYHTDICLCHACESAECDE
jgi:hypothetical protein